MGKKPKNRSNQVATSSTTKSTSLKQPKFTGCAALPEKERIQLEACTLDYKTATSGGSGGSNDDADFCRRAIEILEQHQALVIHNCMDPEGLLILQETYERLHQQQAGQTAIGEKDASKRSGTRLYNCLCQL